MRFVCWLWKGTGFWKPTVPYSTAHVVTLARMLDRHGGHKLACVHDGTFDLSCGVRSILMPPAVTALPDYLPKLWAWSPEFHRLVGGRFASIDLDVVLLEDVAPLLGGEGPVIWDSAKLEPYNSSLFALDPGNGREVWDTLTPGNIARAREAAPYWTGDQSWIAHVLGPDLRTFGEGQGVWRYKRAKHAAAPPPGTRAMFMCGPTCPEIERAHSPWVWENWR